ncbi:hypothetical protein V5O48_004108 [Marasmius crinis-equi]|uniref:DNA-(apurinic or apyrimidinic site) endonuclease n=1 Tax=Marasmius crinis-equi TaxID=585013 RepID=A0ABR3FR13_9AGAR
MPPKRASSSKRKIPESDHDSDSEGSKLKTTKKAKLQSPVPDPDAQPTNTVLPVQIRFAPRIPGTLRFSAWNVCGLATSQKKGFKFYLEAEDPDILVLTETKMNNEPVDPLLSSRYPHRYWSISEKKGYSGTAVLSNHEPLSVDKTIPGHPEPSIVKGRIITLEFENHYFIATYVPNAGTNLKTLDVKNEWNKHFTTYIRELDKKKPVIWTGDLNVAPTEIGTQPFVLVLVLVLGLAFDVTFTDLSNAKKNWNKTPGYTEAETTAFRNILRPQPESEDDSESPSEQFVDVWRDLHPNLRHYTYFSYRFSCRTKGLGWRLDTFVLSKRITEKVKMCEIRSDIYGASDHCPITMEYEGTL